MAIRKCKCGCGQPIHGHPNKKFYNSKHKDRYHNKTNPRGMYAHLKHQYKENPTVEDIEDSMHPQDSYSLGQE